VNKSRREQSKFPEAIEVIKACAERLQDLGALGTPTRTDARDTWGIVRIKNNKNECWRTKYTLQKARQNLVGWLLVDQGISRAYCARITLWPSLCELLWTSRECEDQGHLDEAETLLQRSHRDSGKQLGEQHPVTLSLGKARCDTVRTCTMGIPGLVWMHFELYTFVTCYNNKNKNSNINIYK
jgi:hypothetical protein